MIKKLMSLCCIACMGLGILGVAQGGVLSSAAREAMERIAREVAQESTEAAAKKTARELLEKAARSIPEIAEYVKKFGDDAYYLVEKPARVELCAQFGDDAAEALVKNGRVAEEMLTRFPTQECAAGMKNLSREEARELSSLLESGKVDSSKIDDFWRFVSRHPKFSMASAAAVTGLVVAPGIITETIRLVGTMIEHPVASVFVLLLLASLIWGAWTWLKKRFPRLALGLLKFPKWLAQKLLSLCSRNQESHIDK